jgi:predicted Ser/Thr protein kinase
MERFETISELGSGAFGRVSLVRERSSGRLIALKMAHLGSQPLISARMRREYRALARLEHQNIVRVFELGELDGKTFLALEFVDGVTLETWLQQAPTQTRILEVFIELANALEAVHGAGLLHRDLKPENVMIAQTGTLKLMDFGLSKLDDSSLQLTKVGAMIGTALYMSPEQCRGDVLDARSDWYAFGIMLYRALCGQLPFTGQSLVEVIMAHLQRQAVAPRQLNPSISVGLEALILSLLAKRASDRPSGAVSIRKTLQADRLLQVRMLGRDQEFAKLQQALEQSGVVAITGVAGIGKSFLLEALRHSAIMQFAIGKAIFEDSTPFGMISRVISELAQLQLLQNAPLEQRAWWQKLAPRADLGTDALTAPVVSADAALGKLQLLEAFRAMLAHIRNDVGLIFEDLQWADAASLELLRYALPLVPSAKVIVSYRTDELQSQKKYLPDLKKTIELQALSENTMLQLLQGWLGAPVEAALFEQLIVPAGGNPWFLAERLKSMLEAQRCF